jgi:hypothetical protein
MTFAGTVALIDRGERETGGVTSSGSVSVFASFRFPPEVISVAVRWYLRYGLSYRDVEELLAERAVTVDHVTIYWWVQRFTPEFIEAARPCRHAPGDRWFVDERYVKVARKWAYLCRAIDQHGQVIDVLSRRRDLAAGASSPGRCAPVPSRPRSPPTVPLSTRGSSPSGTRSCRTFAGATMTSLPTSPTTTGSARLRRPGNHYLTGRASGIMLRSCPG